MLEYVDKLNDLKKSIEKDNLVSGYNVSNGRKIEDFINNLTVNQMATLINDFIYRQEDISDEDEKTYKEMESTYLNTIGNVESILYEILTNTEG